MKNVVVRILLAAAFLALPFLASAQSTGYSYLGAWQPPTIYQSNTWYSKTAAFTGPSNATITTVQWQLQWNLNNGTDGIPSGLEMKICDAVGTCKIFTTVPTDGNTTYFEGESATQTFTFSFEIQTAHTIVYNPYYIGVTGNSWLQENYQY